jgi:hypothetical protein
MCWHRPYESPQCTCRPGASTATSSSILQPYRVLSIWLLRKLLLELLWGLLCEPLLLLL